MPDVATCVRVAQGSGYDVVVGRQLTSRLGALVGDRHVVALVHPLSQRERATGVAAALGGCVRLVEVPNGEAQKQADVLSTLWDAFAEMGLGRGDAVVSVGGGATSDLAGFAAASWLRGVDVVHVPTTLLGMVDAAVGGKTGINTSAGKNLVGSVHPPLAVLCDLDALESLPPRDLAAGLAEVVKVGFTSDPKILALIERAPEEALRSDGPVLRELIERAVVVKASVVSADPLEHGQREILNYGHTLGHAIEKVEGYRLRHGDAVSIGLCFAAEVAAAAGRLDRATCERHRTVLASLGLPTTYAGPWAALATAMRADKKSRAGRLRMVVIEGLGRPAILADPDRRLLESAYHLMNAGRPTKELM